MLAVLVLAVEPKSPPPVAGAAPNAGVDEVFAPNAGVVDVLEPNPPVTSSRTATRDGQIKGSIRTARVASWERGASGSTT